MSPTVAALVAWSFLALPVVVLLRGLILMTRELPAAEWRRFPWETGGVVALWFALLVVLPEPDQDDYGSFSGWGLITLNAAPLSFGGIVILGTLLHLLGRTAAEERDSGDARLES